jgi:ribosomal protein S12 methylthiotransferase
MPVQTAISRARVVGRVGSAQRVLVDEVAADCSAVGRTADDAPEIDGVVHLKKPARTSRR